MRVFVPRLEIEKHNTSFRCQALPMNEIEKRFGKTTGGLVACGFGFLSGFKARDSLLIALQRHILIRSVTVSLYYLPVLRPVNDPAVNMLCRWNCHEDNRLLSQSRKRWRNPRHFGGNSWEACWMVFYQKMLEGRYFCSAGFWFKMFDVRVPSESKWRKKDNSWHICDLVTTLEKCSLMRAQ